MVKTACKNSKPFKKDDSFNLAFKHAQPKKNKIKINSRVQASK